MKLTSALESQMLVTRWLFDRALIADVESEVLFRRELINACSAHLSVLKRVVLPVVNGCSHETAQATSAALTEVVMLALSALADYITTRDATATHPTFVALEQYMDALRGIELTRLEPAVLECLPENEAEALGREVEANLEQFGGRRAAQMASRE